MATNCDRSVRRRKRSRQNWVVTSTMDGDKYTGSSAAYIDLTVDVSSDDIIDLTNGNNSSVADSHIEISAAAENVGPVRRKKRTRRRASIQMSNIMQVGHAHFGHSSSREASSSHVHILSDGSDSDSLPEVPFEFTVPSVAENISTLQSPEGVKISCPICMDDTKQIKNSGRQVMSTNCGHIFCDTCIKEAINMQHTCPTCRKKITRRNIHPLFV